MGTEVTKSTTHIIGTHERFTRKMSLALRQPGIKLVTFDWIRKACREWRRPDESLFAITHESNKKRKRGSDDKLRVNIEDEESDQSDGDLSPPDPPPGGNAAGNEEDADADADHDRDASPLDEATENDWNVLWAIVDNEEDEETEEESETGSQVGEEGKKRKREQDSDNESQAGNESDTSTKTGSRKRRELGRTSSLNNVVASSSASYDKPSNVGPGATDSTTNGHKVEEEDDSEFDDFDAELQRALAEAEEAGLG